MKRFMLMIVGLLSLAGPSPSGAQSLREAVQEDYDSYLGELFVHFHRNPELSFRETETASRLASELRAAGVEVTEGVGGTGIVGILANGEGPLVLVRADIDGLPIKEQSGLDYSSVAMQEDIDGTVKPVMHACGHDVHITSLIGTARRLVAAKERWAGTVMLVGQPAEERIGGAKAMLEDGLYRRFGVPDFALAFHVSAGDPAGKVALESGLIASSSDSVDITVFGVGAHGASPHRGKDPIYIASQIVIALQGLVSRELGPLEPGVVTVGSFHGGFKHNIIPDEVKLQLTVRADSEETRAKLLSGIERVAHGVARTGSGRILIVIAYSMVDKKRLKLSWHSGKNSRLVLVSTIASTLVLPLEYAIFVGVILSIVILLKTTGTTDLTQLIPRDGVGFDEVPFNRAAPSPVVIVNMEGDLYFAAAEDLDHELLQCLTPETRVVVLRMKRLRAVGGTAMAILEHFWVLLRRRRVTLVICGIEDELKETITGSGLRREIGEQNIFYADNRLLQSTELALARAWSIVEREKMLYGKVSPVAEDGARPQVMATDLMSPRCLRFGYQHQLREATWLMSELHKHTRKASPEPLFLQDREGRLAGELSPWRILESLAEGTDLGDAAELDDPQIGELLRKNLARHINTLAEIDIERLPGNTPFAKLLELAATRDAQVLPICDDAGRIKGLVSADALLLGLRDALAREEEARDGE